MLPQMNRLWQMVKDEPYRVFFPLGTLAGIFGVMMWPMWYAKWVGYYPIDAHPCLMIECFIGAFAIGFIGTAFPRLTGNRTWFGFEWGVLLALWFTSAASHGAGRVAAGDAAFCTMMVVMFLGMAGRWFFGNRDTPPPGFVLALTGILGAAVAAGYLATSPALGSIGDRWARLFLYQGFILLPLMGIGPYVLPRFFGMSSGHSFDDSPYPPAGWWLLMAKACTAGLLVIASFAMEVQESPMLGQLLRAGIIATWFMLETPLLRAAKSSSTPGNAVRWALLGLVAGLASAAFAPNARVGSLHLFFASGLGLFTLAVGGRVVLGHAGRHDLLVGKIVWLRWVVGLVILAALTRMSADFIPKVKISHHIYAAWTWLAATLIWLVALAKFFLKNEDSPKPRSRCPKILGRPNGQ